MLRLPSLLRRLATVGIAAAAVPAQAGPAPRLPEVVSIEWEVPPGCGSQAAFEDELARQITAAVADALTEPLAISVRVVRAARGWELEIKTPVGTRTLADASCAELLKTAAFVVGMSIEVYAPGGAIGDLADPGVTQAYDPENPGQPRAARPEEEEPPLVIRDAAPPRPRQAPHQFTLRASVGGDLGVLPHPTPGAGVAAGLLRGGFRVEIAASAWASQPAADPANPAQGARLSLWSFGVRGCHDLVRAASLTAAGCVGGELGRFEIEPFGVLRAGEGSAAYWAGSAGATIARELWHPLYFRLDAEVTVLPVAPSIVLGFADGSPNVTLHQPRASARALTGVEVRFR